MKIGKLLTVATALILTAGIAMAARTTTTNSSQIKTTTSAKMTTHRLMGTISSVNGSDLVVAHKYNGKEEDSTFVLNSTTRKEGNLAKGDQVTVHYQVNHKQNIATDVKVNPTKKS